MSLEDTSTAPQPQPDAGRISVSRDALRADLLQLKLDLVKELATKDELAHVRDDVGILDDRVGALERRDADEDAVKKRNKSLWEDRKTRVAVIVAVAGVALQGLVDVGIFR